MSSLLSSTFKDKTRAARAVGSELETAVIKATNHDPVSPKRKHVASTWVRHRRERGGGSRSGIVHGG
jgi:hypothetical protein